MDYHERAKEIDVVNGYRYILGREPENKEVVRSLVESGISIEALRKHFFSSEEFRNRHSFLIRGFSYGLSKYEFGGGRFIDWCLPGKVLPGDEICESIMDNRPFEDVNVVYKVISSLVKKSGNKKSGNVWESLFGSCSSSEKPTMLDIGANVGKFSVLFALNGWNVYSIEASEANIGALRKTVELNRLPVTVCPYILHEKSRKMLFYQYGPWGMCVPHEANEIYEKFFGGVVPHELDAICLNDWKNTELKHIKCLDFVKMDIEGSEVAALRGADNFLEHFHYPPIFCECNKWTLFLQRETSCSFMDAFYRLGYRAYKIVDGKLVDTSALDRYQVEINTDYLFIHSRNGMEFECMKETNISMRETCERTVAYLSGDSMPEIAGTLYSLFENEELMNEPMIQEEVGKVKEKYPDDVFIRLAFSSSSKKR